MRTVHIVIILVTLVAFIISGCAAYGVSPVTGFLYTDVKAPVTATSNTDASKVGTSTATSIFGLIATGDASIQTAARDAGITRIHHVDFHTTSILGIYATFTVYVYGE